MENKLTVDSSTIRSDNLTTPGRLLDQIVIKLTEAGKKVDWSTGKTWGLWLYHTGYDPVLTFTIGKAQPPPLKFRQDPPGH